MLKSTFALLLLLPLAAADTPQFSDETPAANTYNGPSSARFAKSVTVVLDKELPEAVQVARQQKPDTYYGETDEVTTAIRKFALSSARRHFESAEWPAAGKKPKKHPTGGREVVIRRISVEAAQGPSYNVIVEVDRVDNGKRKGSATGRGFGMPDRTKERTQAAFAPGVFGVVAGQKAMAPNLKKDGPVIEQAVLRALDNAFLQLAAVWAGEQMVEDMQKKNRR